MPPLPQWGPGCQAQAGQWGQQGHAVLAAFWHNRLYAVADTNASADVDALVAARPLL